MQFLHQNTDFTFSHFLFTFYQNWRNFTIFARMQFLHQNFDFTCSHFLVTFSHIWYLFIFMSVGWDVKWYFVSCTRISVALNKMFFCSKLAKNAKDQNVKNELWKNSTSNFRCYRYSNKWKVHFLSTRFILPIEESFFLRSLWPFPVLFGCVPHTTSSSEIFCWLTVWIHKHSNDCYVCVWNAGTVLYGD